MQEADARGRVGYERRWGRGYEREAGCGQEASLVARAAGPVRMGQGAARGEEGAGCDGWPYNNALHPAAGRGASSLKAGRCSAPASGERER
jgi:hypothetical protein